MGRAMRVTLPTGEGGVVHLFVVYAYQGSDEDADKLLLTDKLLRAVLAEARVVGVGQPLLFVEDLIADPGIIPCLAKGRRLPAGWLIWLWLTLLARGRNLMLPASADWMTVLGLALRDAFDRNSVNDFWNAWCKGAEAGLFRACCRTGGPVASGIQAFLGRGQLRVRRRRLGSRAVG